MKRYLLAKPNGQRMIVPAEAIEVSGAYVSFIIDNEVVGVATNIEGIIEESLLSTIEEVNQ